MSAINALTLTPALCAIILRKPEPPKFFLFRWFNKGFGTLTKGQTATVGFMIRHKLVTMVLFAGILAMGAAGFARLPTGFLPEEDQGYAILGIQLPSGSALARTKATVSEIEAALKGTPGIAGWVTVGGISNAFSGTASFYAGQLEIPPQYEFLIPALGLPNLYPLDFLRFSPVYTAAQLPPTLIIHTDVDHVIPIDQAYQLEAALHANQVPVEVYYYKDVSHYLQIDENMTEQGREMFYRVLTFAQRMLK
mgnify:CR=1 FL=1